MYPHIRIYGETRRRAGRVECCRYSENAARGPCIYAEDPYTARQIANVATYFHTLEQEPEPMTLPTTGQHATGGALAALWQAMLDAYGAATINTADWHYVGPCRATFHGDSPANAHRFRSTCGAAHVVIA